MEKLLNELVEKLRKACGERLVSVVLYGSAVTGDHQEKFSDINVLCVLSEIGAAELAASERVFQWWREQGSPAPLLLTADELATSTDCFAIEFHDIQRHHRILHGQDVIASLVVHDSFYRAQVEHDLRAKMLRLRQKVCGTISDAGLLRRLLLDSISTFCALFRHALVLHGLPAPATKREAIAESSRAFGFDPAPFETLLAVREGRVKPRDLDPVALLNSYLSGISLVIAAVDRLPK
jgi:Nucleotidyltransferase domain